MVKSCVKQPADGAKSQEFAQVAIESPLWPYRFRQMVFFMSEPPGVKVEVKYVSCAANHSQLMSPRHLESTWVHPRVNGKDALSRMKEIEAETPLKKV